MLGRLVRRMLPGSGDEDQKVSHSATDTEASVPLNGGGGGSEGGKLMSLESLNRRRQKNDPKVTISSPTQDDKEEEVKEEEEEEGDPIKVANNDMVVLTRPASEDEVAAFEIANTLSTIQYISTTLLTGGAMVFGMSIGLFVLL